MIICCFNSIEISIVFNDSYPYLVKNINIVKNFNDLLVGWEDSHHSFDPIEFSVSCNSSVLNFEKVYRNTSYRCPMNTVNTSNIISIRTQIVLPGFNSDQSAVAEIDSKPFKFSLVLFSITDEMFSSATHSYLTRIQCHSTNGVNDYDSKSFE